MAAKKPAASVAPAAPKKAPKPKVEKAPPPPPSFEDQVKDFLVVLDSQAPDFKLEKLKTGLRDLLPVEPGEAVSWGE